MEDKVDLLMNLLEVVSPEMTYKKICAFSADEEQKYNELLERFKYTNSSKCSNQEKGTALEELATFTIKSSHIFEIYRNIRTSTNELDQLVKISDSQRLLKGLKIVDERLFDFIGECKNYQTKVPVTYIGKVCSLLSTTQNKICILFSYNGVTGKDWEDSCGLIKKFYLSKENLNERFCIIDFNINDFEIIKNGGNFLQIIEDKILALKNDTDYSIFLSEHELTSQIMESKN